MDRVLNLAGRFLLAHIFIISGWTKIGGFAGTQAYMDSAGVPGMLLPAVIAVELLGGLALIAGFKTSLTAVGLAAFSIVAAVFFHMDFADPAQTISFMKNLAIAGGLLVLAQTGATAPSVDTARSTYRAGGHAHA
ncbi:MAG TPA: DoxX family protein [Burkholderiales bacterium]|nr:DoxX family protein [Burkholderiales bacterium]